MDSLHVDCPVLFFTAAESRSPLPVLLSSTVRYGLQSEVVSTAFLVNPDSVHFTLNEGEAPEECFRMVAIHNHGSTSTSKGDDGGLLPSATSFRVDILPGWS